MRAILKYFINIQMNALLSIPMKGLIKLVVKSPFTIRQENLININIDLLPSEIAHIILIASRKRASFSKY